MENGDIEHVVKVPKTEGKKYLMCGNEFAVTNLFSGASSINGRVLTENQLNKRKPC